jgi:hypothetical protein
VITFVFVAQLAVYALPVHAIDPVGIYIEGDSVETGTVVQMPAGGSSRGTRGAARDAKAAGRPAATTPSKPTVRRPEPVEDEPALVDGEEIRSAESSVRITIIGPDGQPRTKVVRRSGLRDGIAAPARRPHD